MITPGFWNIFALYNQVLENKILAVFETFECVYFYLQSRGFWIMYHHYCIFFFFLARQAEIARTVY